jgi:outer membrane protein assembly factor BamB
VDRAATTYVLAAGSGRLEHVLQGWFDYHQADFDGDGIPDLYQYRPDQPYQAAWPGKLSALRGLPPAAWRRLDYATPAHDFNGDGVADLLGEFPSMFPQSSDGWGAFAVSGRDGRALWHARIQGLSSPHQADRMVTAAPPDGDLDGDDLADVLLFTPGWPQGEAPLRAFSGKTGRRLWAASDLRVGERERIASAHVLECRDLDGDGKPEVLLAFSRTRDGETTMYLTARSGQDGKLLWEQPVNGLRPAGPSAEQGRSSAVTADLDRDGVRDVVLVGVSERSQWALQAFKGQDGSPLWRYETTANQATQCSAPIVGHLDGSGVPTLIFWCAGQVIALEGNSGRQLWAYPAPGYPESSHWPALVNLDGDGKQSIAVSVGDSVFSDLLMLNGHGHPQQRARLANHHNVIPPGAKSFQYFNAGVSGRLWSIDLDGDGRDELVAIVHRELLAIPFGGTDRTEYWVRASRGGVERVLWEWRVPGEPAEILGVQPGGKGQPATVIVRAGRTVYGLSGPTGRPCWRCEDPRCSLANRPVPVLALLDSDDPRGWPRVVFYTFAPTGQVTGMVCRPAWPALPTGRYAPSEEAPVTSFGPLAADPRFARPLPWATETVLTLWHFLALAAGTLLAVCTWLTGSRRWPLAAGVVLLGLSLFYAAWFDALLALSTGVYVYGLVSSALGRHWGRLAGLLLLTPVPALAVCLPWCYLDQREVGSYRYVWGGWYGALLVGVYATGMLTPLIFGIRRMLVRPSEQG